jgi:bifunctional DNase/RNase
MKAKTMIHVKVAGLSLSNMGFAVLLRGDQDPRTLPIFIGGAEAQAILINLDNLQVPRPLTHDLLKSILDCVECRLKRVVINDLVESTFHAVLVVEHDGIETEIDSRPSDAVALALRCASPIYVVRGVMDKAGLLMDDKDTHRPAKAGAKPGREDDKSGLVQLKAQLEQAVQQERYEDAARLRDEIKKLEQSHTTN